MAGAWRRIRANEKAPGHPIPEAGPVGAETGFAGAGT